MEEKKQIEISLSTLLLIIAIVAIAVMGYVIYNISTEKTSLQENIIQMEIEKVNLATKINQIQETIKDVEVSNVNEKDNNSNNTQENVSYDSEGIIEIGYNSIVALVNGKPYIIPIYIDGAIYDLSEKERETYYKKYEVDNIDSGVKKVLNAYLGTDPSETTYFLMEDGSVRKISNEVGSKYTSTEEVKASENIVDLVYEDGILSGINKNGEKIKIAESMDR